MRLTGVEIRAFRNIRHAELRLQEGVNAVFGENGQGKTNLLESIFLLTGARSFRRSRDRDLILRGEPGASVEAEFLSRGREQRLRLTVEEKGRQISLNRASPVPAASAAGNLVCVVFSPEHLSLVKGAPEERRRFMDTALCQSSRGYLLDLKLYTRLLGQKNNLLKDCQRFPDAMDLLEVYDRQLAAAAAGVCRRRLEFVKSLGEDFKDSSLQLSGGRDRGEIALQCSLFPSGQPTPQEAEQQLRARRGEDLRAGYCTAGPHRDDLSVSLDGQSLRLFGSQGQQRTAVLALKLSEARYMKRATGEEPVLLLDDVLSELDLLRQNDLLDRLGGQAVITCCDPTFISGRTDARLIEVKGGEIKNVS